jgi:uroporphyrinogen decarboxylase
MTALFPKSDLVATMRCRKGALLPCKLDWPIQKICYWGGHPTDNRPAGAPLWRDTWGVGWQKESSDPAMMPFPIEHPLEGDVEALDRLTLPDPADLRSFADLANIRYPSQCLLMGEHPFALYERAWLLMGLQNLLVTMADAPRRVDELFARIGAFELQIARQYIELGVEAAWISDDYGMNSALMFSPDMWRRFVRPHLKRLVDCYHEVDALVVLHTCGNITALIDDLLELGVDVLDPLQPNCNRLDLIRKRTAGRICLCGGIEASVLLAGDVGRATFDTHRQIAQLGAAGGYIVGPDDEWDYPASTRTAMLTAVEHYRDLARRGRS